MKSAQYAPELPVQLGPEAVPLSLQLAREVFPNLPNDWHGVIKHRHLYFTVEHYKRLNDQAWHIFVIELDRIGKAHRRPALDEFKWTRAEAEAYIQQLKTKYNP